MELIVSDTAMIERVLPLTGRDILDIGCGDGSLAVVLAKKGARPRGVDPQLEMIAALDRNLPGTGCVATADALPFPDGTFDGAIFFNSLHHVPSHLMALSLTEAWRVLRPEGRLVIFEPMAEGPYFEVVRLVEDETEVRALPVLPWLSMRGLSTFRSRYYPMFPPKYIPISQASNPE